MKCVSGTSMVLRSQTAETAQTPQGVQALLALRTPSRASSSRTVWLSADCETPSLAAALVKLRSRATGQEGENVVQGSALHLSNRLISACRL